MTEVPKLADDDGLAGSDVLLKQLADLDELARRRRVHEVIRLLAGCTVAVKQEYRDAIVAAGHIGKQDWISALSEATKQLAATKRAEPWAPESRYIADSNGCLYLVDDSGPVLLAKFIPRVVAAVMRDDGAEQVSITRIRVTVPSGRFVEVDVPGEELPRARKWASRAIGPEAVILPATRDEAHVLTAAQILGMADGWETVTEYAHTGWRTIDGRHVFLSASGAIGADGLDTSYHVDLGNERLNGYALPNPVDADLERLRSAVRASLDLRHLAQLKTMAPLLGATYRASLPLLPETSVFGVGQSGSLKTAVSALMCQHYGAGLDHKSLPAEWKSTANALEGIAHSLANVLCVIDDYAPQAAEDPRRLAAAADRVLRGSANTSGRERMRPDGTIRPSKPPRAQILTTGEDIPPGHSLRARLTICEFNVGEVDKDRLTAAQKVAADGLFALAMGGYVRYIAAERDADAGYILGLRKRMVDLRATVSTTGRHLRTPEATAGLLTGWTMWLRYAVHIRAVSAAKADQILAEVTAAMMAIADEQAMHGRESSPAQIYLQALANALTGGHAHLADQGTGDAPDSPRDWGWRDVPIGNEGLVDWRPLGTCIGWVSKTGDVYLDAGAAYEVALSHASKGGGQLATTSTTVHKRLKEGGYLATVGDDKHILVNRRVLTRMRRVLHIRPDVITGATDGADGAP